MNRLSDYIKSSSGLRSLIAILMLCICVTTHAQTSGSVSLVSNYLYRGLSLSKGNPVPQANVNYDSENGWYAGLFGSQVSLQKYPANLQLIGYAGYSHRLLNGVSWETGLAETHYQPNGGNNYVEAFAGLTSEHLNGRIYYSPNYQGQDLRSTYTEFNVTYPISDIFNLLAHAGYLHVSSTPYSTVTSHGDTRFGVGANWGSWNFQLAWVALVHQEENELPNSSPTSSTTNKHTGFFSMSYLF